jgi:hypothetical protein
MHSKRMKGMMSMLNGTVHTFMRSEKKRGGRASNKPDHCPSTCELTHEAPRHVTL